MDLLNSIETDSELMAIVDKIAAKRISRKRELKTKHEKDESFVQCNAGVKLTKKASKSIIEDEDDNTSIYVMTYIDGDKDRTDVFKQCSSKCKDGNDYCGRHQKRFDNDPGKIIDFQNPENYGGYELKSIDDDFFKPKPRSKRSTNKKSPIEEDQLSELVAMMELIRGDPEIMKRLEEKRKSSASPSASTNSKSSTGDEAEAEAEEEEEDSN